MSEKLPVVSGKELIKMMSSLGYAIVRQRGSHIRLERKSPAGTHKITVPDHREISDHTLNGILSSISIWTQIDKGKLKEMLK